jgi:hypothetical protein
MGAGVFQKCRRQSATVRGAPRDPLYVRAADADIGEFPVTQVRKLTQASIIATPFLHKADNGSEHGDPSFPASGLSR